MLRTLQVDKLIGDIADRMNEQFIYIPNAPPAAQDFYLAAIKDSTVAVAMALHRNITDFDVDSFYARAGYPGTHPMH